MGKLKKNFFGKFTVNFNLNYFFQVLVKTKLRNDILSNRNPIARRMPGRNHSNIFKRNKIDSFILVTKTTNTRYDIYCCLILFIYFFSKILIILDSVLTILHALQDLSRLISNLTIFDFYENGCSLTIAPNMILI